MTITVVLAGLYLAAPAGQSDVMPHSTYPLYADEAVAKRSASAAPAAEPDYAKYSDLKIPPLSPEQALREFELEEGFRIEVVAHEPEIVDPVAMDIDPEGRLWVVEMRSYMPVHDRSEEETSKLERVPESRIVVLEDTTGDGMMDHSWVFMDRLILPRSIKVLDDGVLVAEPPNLWFLQDTTGDGIGDTKELVYNRFGDPGSDNVEHMDNSLMWGMDNWIYSVYSDVSLRRIDGQWKTRPFEQLTQWGITQDNWGRLYSSHNSRSLTTHLVPHGYDYRHPEFSLEAGINHNIAESETMWPAHPTGVNRGYRINVIVREDGTLKRSTATCGPVIYRGDQFGAEYGGNAFVPEPAGNLIKRLVNLDDEPGEIEAGARFAYREREFLTSTDERFRPVNLYNAPDGSIYVIDMYRGIFQHARYLTDHLRDYAVANGLHRPVPSQFGRIYRIVREDRPIDYNAPKLGGKSPGQLVRFLTHENGALRDMAQQLLVQRSPAGAIPALEDYVVDESREYYVRLQALWTLEGFDAGRYEASRLYDIARDALDDLHPRIRAAAVRILEPLIERNYQDVRDRLERMAEEESEPYPLLQLLASLGQTQDRSVLPTMARIVDRNSDSPYFAEMALTGAYGREAELRTILRQQFGWRRGDGERKDWILKQLDRTERTASGPSRELSERQQRLFEQGRQQFRTCVACHGRHGEGLEGVAPALDGSEWVEGDPDALVRIVLGGFNGSRNESGQEFAGVMPSHRYLSDQQAASVLTFIRLSWGNDATPISIEEVSAIREKTENRQGDWTPEELRGLVN